MVLHAGRFEIQCRMIKTLTLSPPPPPVASRIVRYASLVTKAQAGSEIPSAFVEQDIPITSVLGWRRQGQSSKPDFDADFIRRY